MPNPEESQAESAMAHEIPADEEHLDEAFPSSDVFAGLAAAFGQRHQADKSEGRPRTLYQPGTLIADKYRLLEQIGEGGMGLVWYAEQLSPIKRKVAIKLIKPGLDSKSVLARFEAERQALALMDHPNIAKVLDGGLTELGHPYFVMELVRGTAITTWCDKNRVGLQGRVELIIPVCQAIHHAHQKGVIHRDIKPSNVMVAMFDGKPVPKVIDFGVAKAFGPALPEFSLHTAFGAVVGTAEYMSPEQAQLNNLDIDTRSDVYSIGVLLYELLAGSTPFPRSELAERGLQEALRVIRDVDPPIPSVRLSTSKMRASIAAQRGIEPKELGKMLRSELDWIIMKSLEKDRERRYGTAIGLAKELERFLRNEPVEACPPSIIYKMRKFTRRYRSQVYACLLLLFALIAGLAGTTYGLFQAEAARVIAEKAEDATLESYRASTDDTIEQLIGSKPRLSPQERRYLESALARWQEFANRTGDDQRSRAIRAEAYHRAANIWERLGQKAESKSKYERAIEIWEALVNEFPMNLQARRGLAACQHDIASVMARLGQINEAEKYFLLAAATKQKLVDDFPSNQDFKVLLARNHESLGNFFRDHGKLDDAEREHRKALDRWNELTRANPTGAATQSGMAAAHFNLAIDYRQMGKLTDAEASYRNALRGFEKLTAEYPDRTSYQNRLGANHRSIGILLKDMGRFDEAKPHLMSSIAVLQPLTEMFPSVPDYQRELASAYDTLGNLCSDAGLETEAEAHYVTAKDMFERLTKQFADVPDFQRSLANSYNNLSQSLHRLGNPQAAIEYCRKAIALEEVLVRQHPSTPHYRVVLGDSYNRLGLLLRDREQFDEAEVEYAKALTLREKLATDYPGTESYLVELGGILCNMAQLKRDSGKLAEGITWFDRAIDRLRPIHESHPELVTPKTYLRNCYWGRAKLFALQGTFSAADWDRAVELTKTSNQTPIQLRRLIAQFRVGQKSDVVAAIDSMIERMANIEKVTLAPKEWFDLACVFAFASTQKPQQTQVLVNLSLDNLSRAVKAGFVDKQLAINETHLAPIRDTAEFDAIIQQISSRDETQ